MTGTCNSLAPSCAVFQDQAPQRSQKSKPELAGVIGRLVIYE